MPRRFSSASFNAMITGSVNSSLFKITPDRFADHIPLTDQIEDIIRDHDLEGDPQMIPNRSISSATPPSAPDNTAPSLHHRMHHNE